MTCQTQTRVDIRWMIRRDMPEVTRIEADTGHGRWSEGDFLAHLRERNCIGMVAEHDDRIVGHMLYELHKDHLRVLNFAVAVDWRRQGVGRQMAGKLIDKLSTHRRTALYALVRESNVDTQLFLRAMRFVAVGIRPGHFEWDTGEDGYEFAIRLKADA